MKTLLIGALCCGGLFLTGCETTVVERHHGPGGYYHDGRSGDGYRGNYHDGRSGDGYHGYRSGRSSAVYRTNNIERTNVNVTNVRENNVTRTAVRTQPRDSRSSATVRSSGAKVTVSSQDSRQPTKKGQAKNHKGKDQEKKHEGTSTSDQ